MRAAALDNKKLVDALIARGLNGNAVDREGMNALYHAVMGRASADLVRSLLAAGAKVDFRDETGNTPLIVGSTDEKFDLVKLLVEHGADIDAQNHEGDTPLTNAAIWGERRTVMYLLAQGANPTLTDGIGCTAAELARQHGYTDIADAIEAAAARS